MTTKKQTQKMINTDDVPGSVPENVAGNQELQALLEAMLLAANKPMTLDAILQIFQEEERPESSQIRQALEDLQQACHNRGIQLIEVASGYQFQVQAKWVPYISRLWEEKAPKYSRAFLETLALIAYRQPITRGEIEEIRGVTLSPSIFKTLLEDREWIRVVGYKDVPGRPALYASTKNFLDYFGLKSLDELPSLPEIMNLEDQSAAGEAMAETVKQMEMMLEEQQPKLSNTTEPLSISDSQHDTEE